MKTSTRIFGVFVLSLMFLPQVTMAAWWNPASWHIFNTRHEVKTAPIDIATSTISKTPQIAPTSTPPIKQKEVKVQPKKLEIKVNPPVTTFTTQTQNVVTLPVPMSWSDLENKYFADATQKGWTSQTITNEAGEKHYYRYENGTWARKNTLEEAQQSYQIPSPPNTTLCNGVSYSTICPADQTWYCPVTGGAICQAPQKPASVVPVYVPVYQTPPPVPIYSGPTVAQQKVQCQQQHDTSVQSISLFAQNQIAYYNRIASEGHTFFNQCGGNGMCQSGMANQAQMQIDTAKTGIADTQASYVSQLASADSLLQQCLNAIIQTN